MVGVLLTFGFFTHGFAHAHAGNTAYEELIQRLLLGAAFFAFGVLAAAYFAVSKLSAVIAHAHPIDYL